MRYAKAVVSAVVAGLACAYGLVDNGISVKDGIAIAIATLTAAGATAWVPNKAP